MSIAEGKANRMSFDMKFKRLVEDAIVPTRAYNNDAGLDLYSLEDVEIRAGDFIPIRTGIAIQLPDETEDCFFEAQIRPRSSTFKNFQILIPNSPATIDFGYRGELIVPAFRPIGKSDVGPFSFISEPPVVIKKGDRFAQLVVNMIPKLQLWEVEELEDSHRGEKGFGSSGTGGE